MGAMIKAGVLAALLCAGGAQAEDRFRVGVVDIERVVREAVPAMKAEKKIEKEFAGRSQDIEKLIKRAKELQETLGKENAKLADAERRAKERELSALDAELQRTQREFREDLSLRKNEEVAIVLELANKAIQEIAEAEKYDLILQEAVYRNPKIDITDKVIQFLDDNSKAAR